MITLQELFLKNVKKERAGAEISKILLGNNPAKSVRDMNKFGIFPLIYKTLK